MKKLFLILLFSFYYYSIFAQPKTQIGFQGSAIRFYPNASKLGYGMGHNNAMNNGLGWSTGLFIQKNWKPRIKPIVEFNFYQLSSNVYIEFYTSNLDVSEWLIKYVGDFQNTSFNQLALSTGVKLNLNQSFYAYPAIEFAQSLNSDIQLHKSTFNARMGFGYKTKYADVILDYSYGLQEQNTIYDSKVYFLSIHRNQFLQLKIQIPIYNLK